MSRTYNLEAVVAAHRAAAHGRKMWVQLSDMEYDAIAGTVLRGAASCQSGHRGRYVCDWNPEPHRFCGGPNRRLASDEDHDGR